MTILSLTSILFVSILVEEVKVFCFVSKSAWVMVETVEETPVIFTPLTTNELQVISDATSRD